MHELIKLYLSALRPGDRRLSAPLARSMRAEPRLAEQADRSLQTLPRGPARWSGAAERVLRRILRRLR